MKLYSFCVLGIMGLTLGCFDKNTNSVIDSTCDMKEVKLPDKWKFECIDPSTGVLNSSLDAKTRSACVNTAANNRSLKRKGCIKQEK